MLLMKMVRRLVSVTGKEKVYCTVCVPTHLEVVQSWLRFMFCLDQKKKEIKEWKKERNKERER